MFKDRLRQLYRDNAGRGNPSGSCRIKNSAEDDEATIYLYDAIGGWYGIEAEQFVKDLMSIVAPTIHLRINSPGGDAFAGRAMAVAVASHPSKIIVHIDGVVASAATFLAMAADEVEIAEGAFFMIHLAWMLSLGNAVELRKAADLLDQVDAAAVTDYQRNTGGDAEQIKTWMTDETWFNAADAVEYGFADRIFEPVDKVENVWNLSAYESVPKAFDNPPDPGILKFDRAKMERRLSLLDRGF